MENKFKVSIIVPCYNAANYVNKTIDSIVNQTMTDIEAIFVDDGSKDNTLEVLKKKLLNLEIDYKIVQKENGGVSSARNKGLEIATGKYVLFLDSDDFIEPNMLELMYNKIEELDLDSVFCGYDYVNMNGEYYKKYDDRFKYIENTQDGFKTLEDILLNNIHIWTGCILYKRELLIKNNLKYYEGCNYGEDFEFICKAITKSNKVGSVPKILSHYLQRENSLVNSSEFSINNFKSLGAMNRLKHFVRMNTDNKNIIQLCEDIFNLETLVIYNRYIVKSKSNPEIEAIFNKAYEKFKGRLKKYRLINMSKERIKRYILVKLYIINKQTYTNFMKKKHNVQ